MTYLNDDIIGYLYEFISIIDRFNLSFMCKKFLKLCQDDYDKILK